MNGSYVEAARHWGSQQRAAAALGIPRTTFRRKYHAEKLGKGLATADALMGVFGFTRVDEGQKDVTRLTANEHVNAPMHDYAGSDIFPHRKTALFLYDVHLPYESEENIEIALDYAQSRHKISHVVLGGDVVDFQKISRFVSPADAMDLVDEIAYGVAWLEKIVKRFKGCSITYIQGNHEERLQRFIYTRSPELDGLKGLSVKEQLELDRLGVHFVDNMKLKRETGQYFTIGKLPILHGHELGICPNVNPAARYFAKAHENLIVGHVHKVNDHYDNTIRNEVKGAFVCGCLCDMYPAYRPQNGWIAGFGMAHFDDDGMFSVKLKKIINGRVL